MKAFLSLLIMMIAISASAESITSTPTLQTETVSTTDTNSGTQLTKDEKSLAKLWMLSESDWVKYKKIMVGPRGIWSPGIDPITALGVEETDPVQRKHYAEIWMKVESRRAELEIAFEMERSIAAKKMFPNTPVVNNSNWVSEWEKSRESVRKIIHLFVDVSCMEKCRDFFRQINGSIGSNAQMAIFFKDGATSEQIGKWAAFMGIPPETVKTKKITLNFDEGKSTKYGVDTNSLPAVKVMDVKTGKISNMEK